ncbi:MAG: hypothetical protein AAGF11_15185 [Myxococcota bacterium]
MRLLGLAVLALLSCLRGPKTVPQPPPTEATTNKRAARGGKTNGEAPTGTRLTSDTPTTTVADHTFIVPAGWSVSVPEALDLAGTTRKRLVGYAVGYATETNQVASTKVELRASAGG